MYAFIVSICFNSALPPSFRLLSPVLISLLWAAMHFHEPGRDLSKSDRRACWLSVALYCLRVPADTKRLRQLKKKSNQPSTDRLMISDWAGRREKQKKTWAKQREVDRLLIVSVIIWIVSCSLQRNMTGFIFALSMRIAGWEWGGKKSVIADSVGTLCLFNFLLYLNKV